MLDDTHIGSVTGPFRRHALSSVRRICFPSEGRRNRLGDGLKVGRWQVAGGFPSGCRRCLAVPAVARSPTVVSRGPSHGLHRLLRKEVGHARRRFSI